MKNKLIAAMFLIMTAGLLTSCDMDNVNAGNYSNKKYSEFGTDYFDKANIDIHTEVITVDVVWWYDYEENETIVIGTKDGKIYYTHNRDCTLYCTESPITNN